MRRDVEPSGRGLGDGCAEPCRDPRSRKRGDPRAAPHSLACRSYLRVTCTCLVVLFPAALVAITRILCAPGATLLAFHR